MLEMAIETLRGLTHQATHLAKAATDAMGRAQ